MSNNVEKKITKAMNYGAIIEHLNTMPADTVLCHVTIGSGENAQSVAVTAGIAIEKLTKEIATLSKKNSGNGKLNKTQEANIVLATNILDYMAEHPNQLFTVTDIIKGCPACAGLSPQKVSPRMTSLFRDGEVKQTKEKGKTFYQYAGSADEE